MNLVVYDLILLGFFIIFVALFLYRNREKLQKQGWLFLYRTSWGIKLINKVGKKNPKTLNFLSYVSITVGYLLMIGILYLVGQMIYIYIAYPNIVQAVKVPPITPLFPYLPQAFNLTFLPPFYFTYWIIILAVIAITHEFAHGIFAALNKVRIKKTGFGFFPYFLPVFLAAFVELDERQMARKSKFSQMAILSAGTFANIITAILGVFLLFGFFSLAFAPSGVVFDDYAYSVVGVAGISMVNGVSIDNATYEKILEVIDDEGLNKIETSSGKNYVATKEFLLNQGSNYNYTFLYYDAPAINSGLSPEEPISSINGVPITSLQIFREELGKYSPGESIEIITNSEEGTKEYEIVLGENPDNPELPYLGVGFLAQSRSGIMGSVIGFISSIKEPNIHYEPKFEAGWFVYNLLWWLIIISFSVALINMLPVGIFDGGRFFYLTVLGITGNRKFAQKSFAFMTYLFLVLLFVIMFFWLKSFF